jgi:hypothetical protein
MKPDMIANWVLNASPLILLGRADLLKTIAPLAHTWIVPGWSEKIVKAKGLKLIEYHHCPSPKVLYGYG